MFFYNVNAADNILIYFILAKVQDGPAALLQVFIFAAILLLNILEAVPVGAVSLDREFFIWKRKVNRPATHGIFFAIFYAPLVEFARDRLFNFSWRVESYPSVGVRGNTTSRTEFAIALFGPGWVYLKLFSAMLTDALDFYATRRLRTLRDHTFLAAIDAAPTFDSALTYMHQLIAIQAMSVDVIGSLKSLKPNIKAFIRTKAPSFKLGKRDSKGLIAFFTYYRCDAMGMRHDKILPIQDNRLDIDDWGRPVIGYGLFGAVDQTAPIPI